MTGKETLQELAEFLMAQYSDELYAVVGFKSPFWYNLTVRSESGNRRTLELTMAMNAKCNYLFDSDVDEMKKSLPILQSVKYSRYVLTVRFKPANYADFEAKQKLAETMRRIADRMIELEFYPCCQRCGEKVETSGHRIAGVIYQVCDSCRKEMDQATLIEKERIRKEAPNGYKWGLITGVPGIALMFLFRPNWIAMIIIGLILGFALEVLYLSFALKDRCGKEEDARFILNAAILIGLGVIGALLTGTAIIPYALGVAFAGLFYPRLIIRYFSPDV